MTLTLREIISPAISATLARLVTNVVHGIDSVLVGPSGCGSSTVASFVCAALGEQAIPTIRMDCRAVTLWQEAHRDCCQAAKEIKSRTGRLPVLVIDNSGDIEPRELQEAYQEITTADPGGFHARLWLGNLDCRQREVEHCLPLIRDPRALVLMPEYDRDDLLRIYPIIGRNHGCEWGEAILYFLHDWCKSDLALVKGISTYLYGDWKDRLYDDSVAECLNRWLIADPIVEQLRNTLKRMEGTRRDYVRLLCWGGKVPCHAAAIEHETDDALRWLFFSGFVTPNLIPGFYQFRNLTVKLLAMQEHVGKEILSSSLLRGSSNARVNVLLQDIELSLRHLLTCCFRQMGLSAIKQTLEATKTDESPMSPELRKSLLDRNQASIEKRIIQ